MKVLLVTQYFYPENFKSNDIAFELVKRGYEVTVLTGIPNYPQGCFFQGYGLFSKKKGLAFSPRKRRRRETGFELF